MDAIYVKIIPLISPAIAISAGVYLVRLWGKIIADAKPFSDDRRLERELAGIFYTFYFVVVPGVLGVMMARHWEGVWHWIGLSLTILINSMLLLTTAVASERIYKINSWLQAFEGFLKDDFEDFKKFIFQINKWQPLWIFSTLFAYMMAAEYLYGNNMAWFIIMATGVFTGFVLVAINHSLRMLPIIDIYFIDNTKPIKSAMLLKFNEDNIRVRFKDSILILNRTQIARIENKLDSRAILKNPNSVS